MTAWGPWPVSTIRARPLGATIGDFRGSKPADGGPGEGTLGTSPMFLTSLLGVVIYLTITNKDRNRTRPVTRIALQFD